MASLRCALAAATVGGVACATAVALRLLRRHQKKMLSWSSSKNAPPCGLRLFENVYTEDEARELEQNIAQLEARLRAEHEATGHRIERRNRSYSRVPPAFAERQQSRVTLQFGAYANANRLQLTERVEPLPACLEAVAQRLAERGIFAEPPETCCVNLYEEGQWIPPHVDNAAFARPFATLSLASEQPVEFSDGDDTFSLRLPVGSVLRVDGEAADRWKHSVPPVSERRVSLTFRRLRDATKHSHDLSRREAACRRDAKAAAKRAKKAAHRQAKAEKKRRQREDDSPLAATAAAAAAAAEEESSRRSAPALFLESRENGVPSIEREHVWRVYDAIAPQWHGTRYKAWPLVETFARELDATVVGDVGCGNGKNGAAICCDGGRVCLACDVSVNLLRIAKRETKSFQSYECHAADACVLPWRSGTLDAVLCIAVLHHISTLSRRRLVVKEAFRCLRVGGRALFYAWALEQENSARSGHRFATADVFVPFHLRQHGEYWHETSEDAFVVENQATTPVPQHATPDAAKNALVLQRYCHVFRRGELEALVRDALGPDARVDDVYYDAGNWALSLTKVVAS